MTDLNEIRRENGRRAIKEHGGASRVAKLMNLSNASFIAQQFGPNPSRKITEKTARKMEAALGLPEGSLDAAPGSTTPNEQAVALVADVIRLVGTVLESESVNLQPRRFADVVALAYADTMEHGGAPRENHVRNLVRLLK